VRTFSSMTHARCVLVYKQRGIAMPDTTNSHRNEHIAMFPEGDFLCICGNTRSRSTALLVRSSGHKIAGSPGFQVAGLVVVRASSVVRARQILEHLTSSLRSRRGPVGVLRITTERGNRSMADLPKTTPRSGWLTTGELVGGVARLAARFGTDQRSGARRCPSASGALVCTPRRATGDGRWSVVTVPAISGPSLRVAMRPARSWGCSAKLALLDARASVHLGPAQLRSLRLVAVVCRARVPPGGGGPRSPIP
jgi:hypothetical protein